MVSSQDYPIESELKKIREWPWAPDQYRSLFDFIKSIWWMPSWGWRETRQRYYISTAGWSGNEEIIYAMRQNFIFWSQCWLNHRTGGHFVFRRAQIEIAKGEKHDRQVRGKK